MDYKLYEYLFHSFKPLQNKQEMWDFIQLCRSKLNKERFVSFLELGLEWGGSSAVWCNLLRESDSLFVGVDRNVARAKKMTWAESTGHKFFVEGDSMDDHVVNQVAEYAKDYSMSKKFDIIFVDADHCPEATVKDLTNYGKLINSQGIIGIHDAGDPEGGPIQGIKQFKEQQNFLNIVEEGLIHNKEDQPPDMKGIYWLFIDNDKE